MNPREFFINAADYVNGLGPTDPTMYMAYYQGEYDKDGNLLNGHQYDMESGSILAGHDPFLYWLIPIFRQPKESQPSLLAKKKPGLEDYDLMNYLDVHTKDKK